MSETNMSAFVNGYASLVNSYVLVPVVQHLQSRGVQVTAEELSTVLQLPAQRANPAAYPTTGAPLAFGGATPLLSPSVAPTKSKPRAPAVVTPGTRLCEYKYKRGNSRGDTCGKPTAGGAYCNTCLKSRKNLTDTGPGATAPGVAPAMSGIPGAPGMAAVDPNAGQVKELAVEEYDKSRNLFREINTNIMIHQDGEHLVAIGKFSFEENKILPLSPSDQQQAISIGLAVHNMAPVPAPQAPVPVAPLAPVAPAAVPHAQAPFMPAAVPQAQVPHMPSAVPSAVPQAQVPHMPSAVPHAQVPFMPSAVPSAVPHAQVPFMPSAVPSAVPHAQVPFMPAAVPHANSPHLPAAVHTAAPVTNSPQIPSLPVQVPVMPALPVGAPGLGNNMPSIPNIPKAL